MGGIVMKKIHILHTNDLHSHFEYWSQIHQFLTDKRKQLEADGHQVFVFDVGDFVDRSHPFTEATNGKGNIEFLNAAQYDAVTIGNNEGITLSKESLASLYEQRNFEVILGNVRERDGQLPNWAQASKVYTTIDGIKIGIVGATAYYEQFYDVLGWTIEPPKERLIQEVQKLKDETDIIICLSHLGIHEDRVLAEICPKIDVILGAHTHHILPEGEYVQQSLLAATGKFGDFVGHIELTMDETTHRIEKKEARLYQASDLPKCKETTEFVHQLLEKGKQSLNERAFYNRHPLKANLFSESELASFFGRALLDYTKADCALFNAGIFLGSLPKGWVTKGDLHQLLPHPINVCTIELTGEQLQLVYEQSMNPELPTIEVKGLGFRGTLMGALIHERLYKNNSGQLFVGNRLVIANEHYTLATLDMFTFGFFFPIFEHLPKNYLMPDLIRDVFEKYGQKISESTTLS